MAEETSDPAVSTNDLGDQLYCSICMQILFQPLTLLDCFHTFCGACLKDWFAHQAAHARSIHPYTCPECRASVRDTGRNALVNTLLELELQRHPEKARSAEDKLEQRQKYAPGDNVMPKLRARDAARVLEDDRVLNEVMAMSLRERGITDATPSNNTLQEPVDDRRRGNSRDGRARSRHASRSPGVRSSRSEVRHGHSRTPSGQPDAQAQPRQVEHQSSLISLMSASDMNPQEMQDEIMRQIAEDGLLDGMDLNNLDASQEEELSERIARAYQERRRQRREASRTDHQSDAGQRSPPRSNDSDSGPQNGTERATAVRASDRRRPAPSRPPVSNPQLIDSVNHGQSRARYAAGATRSTSRPDQHELAEPIADSSRSIAPTTERRRRASNERRRTDPERQATAGIVGETVTQGAVHHNARVAEQSHTSTRERSGSYTGRSPRLGSSATFPRTGHNSSTSSLPLGLDSSNSDPTTPGHSNSTPSLALPTANVRPASSSSTTQRPTLFTEPSITCHSCKKPDLEYEVHYKCPICSRDHAPFSLCKQCYRNGKGCLNWYGFGSAAMKDFEARGYTEAQPREKPHVFTAQRYMKSRQPLIHKPTQSQPGRKLTEDSPGNRLERGVFCDGCANFANSCYWKCNACNDGEWGFCNDCVNQGHHCTHPLLPLKVREDESATTSMVHQTGGLLACPSHPDAEHQPAPSLTPRSASVIDGPVVIPVANLPFQPLTFHTLCDVCDLQIPPSVTRYHCPECNGGDFDICMSCYHGLVARGTISSANGNQGWRRCPRSHRMVVIGFQDSGGGQRRVVDRDLVGGWTMAGDASSEATVSSAPRSDRRRWYWDEGDGQEQSIDSFDSLRTRPAQKLPPDGGTGFVYYALWTWFPDWAKDEQDLVFPRGAEIRECTVLNSEWLGGWYAGRTGAFPAVFTTLLRKVGV